MEVGRRPSTKMTNTELKAELDYLTEQVRKERLERGLPEKQPDGFVSIAMAWTLYERCEPLFKFAIKYAQLCDQADEILELTDEQITWIKSFQRFTDLITKVKGSVGIKGLGGSLSGLISGLEKHNEYETVIELLRSLLLHIQFLKGEYYPHSLHQYVYLFDVSKEENDKHREKVYAEVERLKDEEYFEEEFKRLTEHYQAIKHLY